MNYKNKYIPLLFTPTLLTPLFAMSCIWHSNDNKMNITKERYNFYNLTNQYNIKQKEVNLYFKKGENVPYVSIAEMIKSLDGFLNADKISYYENWFSNSRTYFQGGNKMTVDWKKNKISVNSLDFFSFTKRSSTTNYSSHLKYLQYNAIKAKGHKPTTQFDLDKYNLDILNYYNKTLVPLPVFNTLFCSQNYYNLYFNGQNLYGAYFGLNDNQTGIDLIKKGGFENKPQNTIDRKTTLNHLLWTLDHFYGLKPQKGIDEFKKYLSDEDVRKILSTDVKDNNSAYSKLFYQKLNDLHTWMSMLSFYNDGDTKVNSLNTDSENEKSYNNIREKLLELRRNRFGYNEVPPVRLINNTAIISFDQFKTGTKEEISSPDAYKHDTYEFMKYVMKEIKKRGKTIKNIVMDLSLNGGGSVAAMMRALGFLTNRQIETYDYDTLEKMIYETVYKVDTNGDGKYNLADGYPEYKWHVLTGRNTFSAANSFAAIAREMGIAKIIGQHSGGGECIIMPNVLADGTSFVMSSNNASRIKNKYLLSQYRYQSIEGGIDPNTWFDYDKFYDDSEIDKLVNR